MATDLTPSFYRPTLHGPSRSYCPVAWGSGVLLPGWPVKDLFFFNGATVNLIARVDASEVEDGNGFIGAALDSQESLWLISVEGKCYTTSVPTSVVLGNLILGKDILGFGSDSTSTTLGNIGSISLATTLPYGGYVGTCSAGTSSGVYVTSAAGGVFYVTSGSYDLIGSFETIARSPTILGGNLYAALPSKSAVGVMDLSSGAVTTQDCGIAEPAFCQSSTYGVWLAGTQTVALGSGGVFMGTESYGLSFSGTTLSLVSGTDPDLAIINSVTVSSDIVSVFFIDTTNQALVLTSESLAIYNVVAEVLTLSQTFTIDSPADMGVTPDHAKILVASGSSILVFTGDIGTWAQASDTISQEASCLWVGVTSISTDADPTVICGSGANVTVLESSGATWAEYFSLVVTGSIDGFAGDKTGVLTVSSDTENTYVASVDFDGKSLGDSITLSGISPKIAYVSSGTYAVLTSSSSGSVVAFLTVISGQINVLDTTTLPYSTSSISWTGYSLWVGGYQYQKGAPGSVTPITESKTALVSGSSVKSWTLPSRSKPSGIALGLSNIIITLADNTVITQGISGGDPVEYDLSVFAGQDATTPMNLAGAVLGAAEVLLATSASGEAVVIEEDW